MGLRVQPLEEPLAQALRWAATHQQCLGTAGQRPIEKHSQRWLIGIIPCFWGERKTCSLHH